MPKLMSPTKTTREPECNASTKGTFISRLEFRPSFNAWTEQAEDEQPRPLQGSFFIEKKHKQEVGDHRQGFHSLAFRHWVSICGVYLSLLEIGQGGGMISEQELLSS